MNFEIVPTTIFKRAFKHLLKKYRSLPKDILEFEQSLKDKPFQGIELTPGLRKVRMAISSKGRGKSGGARVITYTILVSEEEGVIYLMDIYDKAEYSTVDVNTIKKAIEELGL